MKQKKKSNFWMVKQEPETYSWTDFVREGRTDWTGVRNYQARNNLREMNKADSVLFYHSGKEKAVVGICRRPPVGRGRLEASEGSRYAGAPRSDSLRQTTQPLTADSAIATLGNAARKG
jgi:hypothetical protein